MTGLLKEDACLVGWGLQQADRVAGEDLTRRDFGSRLVASVVIDVSDFESLKCCGDAWWAAEREFRGTAQIAGADCSWFQPALSRVWIPAFARNRRREIIKR